MFKRRSLQVSVVKNPKTPSTDAAPAPSPKFTPEEIQLIGNVAKVVGAYAVFAVVTIKFSDAACEIAKHNLCK